MAPHPLPLGLIWLLEPSVEARLGGSVSVLKAYGCFPWKQMQFSLHSRRCWRCLQPVVWCPAENSGTGLFPLVFLQPLGCVLHVRCLVWAGSLRLHGGTPTIMGECRHLPRGGRGLLSIILCWGFLPLIFDFGVVFYMLLNSERSVFQKKCRRSQLRCSAEPPAGVGQEAFVLCPPQLTCPTPSPTPGLEQEQPQARRLARLGCVTWAEPICSCLVISQNPVMLVPLSLSPPLWCAECRGPHPCLHYPRKPG